VKTMHSTALEALAAARAAAADPDNWEW
jgi:hypothetical protein